MLKHYSQIKAIPLQGGAHTKKDPAQLPYGAFSMVRNLRGQHPGFKKRLGQIKQHSTADGTNKVLSMYQFKKGRVSETHTYAQMSDGDILEAATAPPGVTTGAFGAEVFSGSAGQIAASWTNITDQLIHSNGVDQHQIYGGDSSYVDKFIVYKGAAAIPDIPKLGLDYSDEVSDGDSSTVAVLDDLSTVAAFDCLFVGTDVPVKSFTFTIPAPNGNASVMTINYRKNDNTWAATSGLNDGTAAGGVTLATTGGTASFTEPTDLIPKYLYGVCKFWYQIVFSATLDAEVEISSVTYDSSFQDIVNVWDGSPRFAVEVQVEGTTQYQVFGSGSVDLDELGSGKKIMIAATDPIEAVYIDPGKTPNATGTTLTSFKYWDGSAMQTVGTVTDGTNGMSNAGWMTFPRKAAHPHQFGTSQHYAYWYELIWNAAIAADVSIAVDVMPYFEINEFGKSRTSCAWHDRASYSFSRWGEYLYLAQTKSPLVLNGEDFGILKAGDGRANKIVAQRNFHNNLMVWQEEKGVEGGCVTIFEGYTPTTFGKLILSSKIGAMNNKSVTVVDGVLTSQETDKPAAAINSIKLAFFLSRYGVCACDGRSITIISDEIGDYFDPTHANCIRRGYEPEMWLEHDTTDNVLRMALVSGSSATLPNVFPVFDLVDKTWSFDTPAQELSCMTQVEAGSGNVAVVQLGGGIDDGLIYILNSGTNDVAAAIDSYLTMELGADGEIMDLLETMLRMKVQAAGDITATFTTNDTSAQTKTLSMTAEKTNETIRRHRFHMNIKDQHISVKLQHNTVSQSMFLYSIGFHIKLWKRA